MGSSQSSDEARDSNDASESYEETEWHVFELHIGTLKLGFGFLAFLACLFLLYFMGRRWYAGHRAQQRHLQATGFHGMPMLALPGPVAPGPVARAAPSAPEQAELRDGLRRDLEALFGKEDRRHAAFEDVP